MANKVAVVDKYKTKIDYSKYFDEFDFDEYHLCDTNIKRVLKKDISEEFLNTFDSKNYEYVILIGAEPCKHVANISSVVKYQGYLCDDKYIPLTNPSMLKFKPEAEPSFFKAVSDINNYVNGNASGSSKVDITLIDNQDNADLYISDLLLKVNSKEISHVALDTETSSLSPRDGYILGLCISFDEYKGTYISSDVISEEFLSILQEIINKVTIIFHNAKFDIKFMKYHFNLTFPKWEDTILLHYLLDERTGTHGLKDLAIKYTDLGDYDKDLDQYRKEYAKKNGIKLSDFTYDLLPFEILGIYGATDPVATLRLFNLFYQKVMNSRNLKNVYENILKPGTEFIIQMEETGIPFNKGILLETRENLEKSIIELENSLYNYKEVHQFEKEKGKQFNPNSPIMVRYLLFNILNLPIPSKRTETGAISVDAEVLEGLKEFHDIPDIILKIKKEKKIKSTYIDKIINGLDTDNRIRTGFHLYTTTSGRLSSSGVLNAQQFPRDDKRPKLAIRAEDGYKMVNMDLGTAEMYYVSALSGDKNLQQIFIDGADYHSMMAKIKYNLPYTWQEIKNNHDDLRQAAKTVSFEILYKLNLNEAALKGFPTLKNWLKARIAEVKKNGYIYSFFGRKRRVPNVFSSDKAIANHEVRSAINFLVQSVSSDSDLLGAIDLQKWINDNNYQNVMRICALVHDSILAEVKEEFIDLYIEKARYFLQKDRGINIKGTPIKVDAEVGDSYGSVKPYGK
jgi:DNA polymerase I-like protein with 3'-5' exonuclease and polymerase domains